VVSSASSTLLPGELALLRVEIFQYDADIPVRRVTAVDRFSDRA
jgi:hypothetical protein